MDAGNAWLGLWPCHTDVLTRPILPLAVLVERPTEAIAAWSAAIFSSPNLKEQVERHHAAAVAAATGGGASAAEAAGAAAETVASESEPDAKPPAVP